MTAPTEQTRLKEAVSIDDVEVLARVLQYQRWPGRAWSGCDVSRSYWRRKARSVLTGTKG